MGAREQGHAIDPGIGMFALNPHHQHAPVGFIRGEVQAIEAELPIQCWSAALVHRQHVLRHGDRGELGHNQTHYEMNRLIDAAWRRRDRTIPARLGEKLFAAANPPKQWRVIEGGEHSDLDLVDPALYQSLLRTFTRRYLGPSP